MWLVFVWIRKSLFFFSDTFVMWTNRHVTSIEVRFKMGLTKDFVKTRYRLKSDKRIQCEDGLVVIIAGCAYRSN